MTKRILKSAVRRVDDKKKDKEVYIPGLLGIDKGEFLVNVPNRPGFVYVRLRSNQNELIQAYNDTVAPVYNLPILVVRDAIDPTRYRVQGRDLAVYSNWGNSTPYLPSHGGTHSIAPTGGGGDPVWVYGRQFMPLNVTPSGTAGAQGVIIDPFVYYHDDYDQYKHAGGTGTASIVAFKPTDNTARMVLVYLDLDGNPQLMPGDTFTTLITGTAGVLPYVPTISQDVGMPLAAARLVSGTSSIVWNNLYDLRPIITGDDRDRLAFWNDAVFLVSGSSIVYGDNLTAIASGTSVFVSAAAGGGGGGGGSGIVILDDGVFQVTGTAIDFMDDLTVVVTGSTAFVSSGGCVTHACDSNGFQLTGGTSDIATLNVKRNVYVENDYQTAGNARGVAAIDLQIGRSVATYVAAGAGSFLLGGANNRAESTYSGVIGGSGNLASDANSVIVGGENNETQGDSSVILGGLSNVIESNKDYSSILGGVLSHIGNSYSYAFGIGARTTKPGISFGTQSAGGIGTSATTQVQGSWCQLSLDQTMVTGTWYNLEVVSSSDGLPIPSDSVWTFRILLIGAISGMGNISSYEINGAIKNDGGTTSLLASNVTVIHEDDSSYDAQVVADDTNDKLQVQVMQSSGSSVRNKWTATIFTAEIQNW